MFRLSQKTQLPKQILRFYLIVVLVESLSQLYRGKNEIVYLLMSTPSVPIICLLDEPTLRMIVED
jgi:hypothetical protein